MSFWAASIFAMLWQNRESALRHDLSDNRKSVITPTITWQRKPQAVSGQVDADIVSLIHFSIFQVHIGIKY